MDPAELPGGSKADGWVAFFCYCSEREPHGARLVWNDYEVDVVPVFLSLLPSPPKFRDCSVSPTLSLPTTALLLCFFSSVDTGQACDSRCPLPAIAASRMISLGHCHLSLLVPNFWREDFNGEVKRAHGCLLSKWPPHIMIMKVKPLQYKQNKSNY